MAQTEKHETLSENTEFALEDVQHCKRFPERLWGLQLWRYSKPIWLWPLATGFS